MKKLFGVVLLAGSLFAQGTRNNGSPVQVGGTNFGGDAGSTDAYAITLNPALPGYATGACYSFTANTANTGAASLNINSLGAKTIVKVAGGVTTALADNDIRVGQLVMVCYDGTNLQIQSTLGNGATGAPADATYITQTSNSSLSAEQALASLSTGVVKVTTSTGVLSNAAAADIYGLWSGSCSSATLLHGAGACGAVSLTADVSGQLTVPNGGSGAATLTGVLKGNGTSAFSAATAGTDYTSPSSTESQTNKTYDAEATGNVLKMPAPIILPAGGCQGTTPLTPWDLPPSTPAVAACVTGTNIQKGVLAYADTSGGFSAQTTFSLPADWTTGTAPDVDLYWTTTATSGNVKWTVQFVCTDVAASATDDPAFPSSSNGFNTVTTAAPGTGSRVQTSTISSATLPASCVTATKELLHIRVFRDGNDAADTIGATANLIGVALTVRRSI